MPESDPPARLIDWTGERCVPWTDDFQVVFEHYHRYLFALPLVEGKRVLDLASGEGYGSALLAGRASSVTGIEIDELAVKHSRLAYQHDHVDFQVGDIRDLSRFPDDSFDVVICYEAIEHVEGHDQLVGEVARVLVPDGVFVVSTPDRVVYTDEMHRDNPFHVHELSEEEFDLLLGKYFDHRRIWSQLTTGGSLLAALEPDGSPTDILTLTRSGDTWVPGRAVRPPYLVALASPSPLPSLPDYSQLLDTGMEMLQASERRAAAIRSDAEAVLREVDERSRLSQASPEDVRAAWAAYDDGLRSLERARRSAVRSETRRAKLVESVEAGEAERARLAADLAATSQELAQIKASSWWRLGTLYRRAFAKTAPAGSRQWAAYRRLRGLDAPPPATSHRDQQPDRQPGPMPPVPSSPAPDVSVVIPVHNHWQLTADCLRSISSDQPGVEIEVLVVDDASTDRTPDLLSQVPDLRVLRLEDNAGFIGAVNAGLAHIRGRYVVFLNNDTLVRRGWIDALTDMVERSDRIGVVGAKLLDPNGRLQEAGGVIFQDGRGANYGRGDDPAAAAYNFWRDVDYCSGACLLVRREILNTTNGLDAGYAPAYYEDTDLAFMARELGYRVVYQPQAVVTHIEGGSHGTDVTTGVKRHQEINRQRFQERWRDELATQLPPDPAWIRAGSWRPPAGRAVVIDGTIPTPDRDSGSRRMFEILSLLASFGVGVSFVPYDGIDRASHRQALERLGVEVLAGLDALPEFLTSMGPKLDLAIVSRPLVAERAAPLVRELSPDAKLVYDTVDLHFVREGRRAEVEGDDKVRAQAEGLRRLEVGLSETADATWVVSPAERTLLQAEVANATVDVIPNIHRDAGPRAPFEQRHGVLFVGSFPHRPNRDAAQWLVSQILPLVRDRLPGVPTIIAGYDPTDEVLALAGDDVQVLGWVPDLSALYEQVRLFVAPLRYGAGMKGKVGESMAYGLPVVTTRLGAEGMGLEDGHDVLVADDAKGFADAMARLYHDQRLWTHVAVNGRATIRRCYSPATVRPVVGDSLRRLGLAIPE